MADEWLERWNHRYSAKEYAYGIEPNNFLKEELQKLKPGSILFGAEGEGRNAVYAAKQGWQVFAFDISNEGKNKALQLAEKEHVSISYQVGQLPHLQFEPEQFDAIALVYAHFPPAIKSAYHHLLSKFLKKGGTLIFEAFGKNHLEYLLKDERIGGPADIESLFSTNELTSDFENYQIITLEETEIELSEGLYHNGKGSVTRFVGRKPS